MECILRFERLAAFRSINQRGGSREAESTRLGEAQGARGFILRSGGRGMYARGLSVRDIERTFTDRSARCVLTKSAAKGSASISSMPGIFGPVWHSAMTWAGERRVTISFAGSATSNRPQCPRSSQNGRSPATFPSFCAPTSAASFGVAMGTWATSKPTCHCQAAHAKGSPRRYRSPRARPRRPPRAAAP